MMMTKAKTQNIGKAFRSFFEHAHMKRQKWKKTLKTYSLSLIIVHVAKKFHKGDHHDEAKLNYKKWTLSSTHEKGGGCNHVGNKPSDKNKKRTPNFVK
jgi:hypothetical protein